MADKQDKELNKITKQVNHTLEMSDILAGRKPIGGKIGAKLQKKQEDELDVKKGKPIRDKKFKQFDAYCERLENVVNNHSDKSEHRIKIERTTIINPKNPERVI